MSAFISLELFENDPTDKNFEIAVRLNQRLVENFDPSGHANLVKLFGRKGRDNSRALDELARGIQQNDIATLRIAEHVYLTGSVQFSEPEQFPLITQPDYEKALDLNHKLRQIAILRGATYCILL